MACRITSPAKTLARLTSKTKLEPSSISTSISGRAFSRFRRTIIVMLETSGAERQLSAKRRPLLDRHPPHLHRGVQLPRWQRDRARGVGVGEPRAEEARGGGDEHGVGHRGELAK